MQAKVKITSAIFHGALETRGAVDVEVAAAVEPEDLDELEEEEVVVVVVVEEVVFVFVEESVELDETRKLDGMADIPANICEPRWGSMFTVLLPQTSWTGVESDGLEPGTRTLEGRMV
jgi:hypothetical protein